MRWRWEVDGTELRSRPLAMAREMYDRGVVDAEGSGDALDKLVQPGPFWDMLDQDESVTITLTPLAGQ